jgi:hypothetical protein
MITYEEVRPGDTFVRQTASGISELRRVLPDGTSELVKRLCDGGDPNIEAHPHGNLPASPH